jgi:hypothetical protein
VDRTARFKTVLALSLLVSLVATGCEIDVGVGVDVAEDGSGDVDVAVTLDPDAAARVTDLAGQLRVDDLVDAGWVVDGPSPEPDGSVVVTATKPFADLHRAVDVLEEISGVDGPFRSFELRREQSFLTTTYHFSGEVDLTAGVEGFSDEGLRRRLEGSGFGLGTAEVEQLTGAPVGETFHFEVRTRLPGALVDGPPTASDAEAAVWTPKVGERTTLAATSRLVHTARLVWLLAAAAAAVALLAVVLARRRRRT